MDRTAQLDGGGGKNGHNAVDVEMIQLAEKPPKNGSRDKTQPSENELSNGIKIDDQQHFEKSVEIAADETKKAEEAKSESEKEVEEEIVNLSPESYESVKEQILSQIYTIYCHYPSDDPIFDVEPDWTNFERRE